MKKVYSNAVNAHFYLEIDSARFYAHLRSSLTTLCVCARIETKWGRTFYRTNHAAPLLINGQKYSVGMAPTNVAQKVGLSADDFDFDDVVYDSHAEARARGGLTEDEVLAGLLDDALVQHFWVNWADLSMGKMLGPKGNIGAIDSRRNGYTARVRGLSQRTSQQIVEVTSPLCRARLGDARCKVNLNGQTVQGFAITAQGTVTSVASRGAFRASGLGAYPAQFFRSGAAGGGKLTWRTGANTVLGDDNVRRGYVHQVRAFNESGAGDFALQLHAAYNIAVGDTFSVYAGCNGTIQQCVDDFNNALNNQSEPGIPGPEHIASGDDA